MVGLFFPNFLISLIRIEMGFWLDFILQNSSLSVINNFLQIQSADNFIFDQCFSSHNRLAFWLTQPLFYWNREFWLNNRWLWRLNLMFGDQIILKFTNSPQNMVVFYVSKFITANCFFTFALVFNILLEIIESSGCFRNVFRINRL